MSTPANLLIPEPTTNATAARIKLTDYLNKIITRCITDQGAACFSPPPPRSTNEFTLTVGNTPPLVFKELDWGTTFTAFAHNIPHSTRNRFLLTETNKCFIIHLAMAANLSPIRLWAQLKKHVLHRISHPLLRADLVECLADILNSTTQLTDQILECTTTTPLSTLTIVIVATGQGAYHTQNDLQAVNIYPPTTTTRSTQPSSLQTQPIYLHHNTHVGHFTVLQPVVMPTDGAPLQATHLTQRLRQAAVSGYIHAYDRETALQEYPY
jgi:hypothetical protein